jgi:hypothetical protein
MGSSYHTMDLGHYYILGRLLVQCNIVISCTYVYVRRIVLVPVRSSEQGLHENEEFSQLPAPCQNLFLCLPSSEQNFNAKLVRSK